MAGIGFELRKIYRKKHIYSLLQGIGYSSVVTIGPTIITIGVIVIMYRLLGVLDVRYADRELLSSTMLYAFIFPLIVTTPFNAVMSRYIADKIFENKMADILPSYYTGLILSVLIQGMISIPFYIRLYLVSGLGAFFVFSSYCLAMVIVIIFYSMIYLTATKDYRIITSQFLIGMVLAATLGYLFVKILDFEIIPGALYALTIGFFYIAVGEFAYIKKYFTENSGNYKESLTYFLRFKKLYLSGLFYILGLYCHNFIFWNSDLSIIVAKSYISAPSYDMATYLGMLTNISAMVIFIVMVETGFHERYKTFSEAIIHSTLRDIEKAKNDMFRLLIQQMTYVAQVQAIITSIIFLLVIIFLPSMGFSGLIMNLYPAMAVGYFCIFIMYCNIIFLYYFSDMTGAFLTSFLFFIGVLTGSLISMHFSIRFYGMGTVLGGFIGWTFSFFRIKYLEKNLFIHIYHNGSIIDTKKADMPSQIVYSKGSTKQIEKTKGAKNG